MKTVLKVIALYIISVVLNSTMSNNLESELFICSFTAFNRIFGIIVIWIVNNTALFRKLIFESQEMVILYIPVYFVLTITSDIFSTPCMTAISSEPVWPEVILTGTQ